MGICVSEADLEFIREGRKKQEILKYFLGNLDCNQLRECGNRKEILFLKEARDIQPIAGVPELLDELRRCAIRLAVASCGTRLRVHHLLESLRMKSYFDAIVTGDEVALGKPDPAIFYKAARQMNLQPEDVLVFEDSVSGVLAATVAGMKCIGIAGPERSASLLQAGATFTLPDFIGWSMINMREVFSDNLRAAIP